LLPAHEAGRRTGADGVGRFAGQVGREIAAAFRHDAQAAEGEDFQRHRRGAGQLFHLVNRQHARQYDARDVEVAMIEANGLFIGGGSLYRNVTLNMRITLRGVLQHGDIGQNERIGAQLSRHIHRALPAGVAVGMGEGVDGDMQLTTVLMHKADGFLQFLFGEIKAGKVAGVGVIFQPDIDGIGAVFDGRLKRRKVTGWAEQLHNFS
jgi:hypothetical protein